MTTNKAWHGAVLRAASNRYVVFIDYQPLGRHPPGRNPSYNVAFFSTPTDGQWFLIGIDELNLEDFPDVCPVPKDAPQLYRVRGHACTVAVRVSTCEHHPDSDSFVVQIITDRGTFNLCRVATEERARVVTTVSLPAFRWFEVARMDGDQIISEPIDPDTLLPVPK